MIKPCIINIAGTYTIDVARKLVISKVAGVEMAIDLLAQHNHLRSDPLFRPDFGKIKDFSATTGVQVTGDDIRRLIVGSPFRSGSRRSLVVPRPALIGIGRMYQILSEDHGVDLRLFDNLAEASRWLGIEA